MNSSNCGGHLKTPKVSIVIPGHNQSVKTIQCIQSIIKHSLLTYEIVFINNGSDDLEMQKIQQHLDKVDHTVIHNEENTGFVKATNQGIKVSKYEYIIMLNNDTTIETPHWDDLLVKPLMKDPTVGAVGAVTQSGIAWQEVSKLKKSFKINYPRIQKVKEYHRQIENFKYRYLDVKNQPLAFFCTAFKREIFNEIGYLDENFHIGLGDDDEFCLRLRSKSYKLLLSLGCFIFHHHRTTFKALDIDEAEIRKVNMPILRQKRKKYGF